LDKLFSEPALEPVDWNGIIADLIFWGQGIVCGWAVQELPAEVLGNFYGAIAQRQQNHANNLSWSAALGAAAAQTKEGDKINPIPWLPFVTKDDKAKPKISAQALALIIANKDLLPIKAQADLNKYGFLK
jgi:hypothetical protein